MGRTIGEWVIFWTLPAIATTWIAAFFLFPGFVPPMSPKASATEVAAFYGHHAARVQYSMILFNWFCVALIPILMLIVERMRVMAHHTPVMRYCVIGVAGAAPISFLTATVFWLIAAFRPYRAPAITQLCNDLAWITFACGVPFLIALCVFVAVAIYFDAQGTPVFPRWFAHFNLLIGVALVPAGFAGFTLTGPFAWNGLFAFWLRNLAITVWIAVTAAVLGQSLQRSRTVAGAAA